VPGRVDRRRFTDIVLGAAESVTPSARARLFLRRGPGAIGVLAEGNLMLIGIA
jgi:hypothetical protein